MAPHTLIKLSCLIVAVTFLSLARADAPNYECQDKEIKSNVVTGSEKTKLCFMEDTSFFISNHCISMNCAFIDRLKKLKVTHSIMERPGSNICKQLGGLVEKVSVSCLDEEQDRCVFIEDRSTISLNLLESWNGKYFTGPAPEVEF